MDGKVAEDERIKIIDAIKLLLEGQDELHDVDWGAQVIDDADRRAKRLDDFDTQRREHEKMIKTTLAKILPVEMGFRGARLSWTMCARLARSMEVADKSTKLRILIGMFPDDFDPKKFTEEMQLRSELDLPEKVDIIFSTPNKFTKKGNLVNQLKPVSS